MKPYKPECFLNGNKPLYKYGFIDIDRSGNYFDLTIQVYVDKKGVKKEQILYVKHLTYKNTI